jgi:hypothetical protein
VVPVVGVMDDVGDDGAFGVETFGMFGIGAGGIFM